jgi:subtilase family serine protease
MYLFSYLLHGKRAMYLLLATLILLLTACTNAGGAPINLGGLSGPGGSHQGSHLTGADPDTCPASLSFVPNCQTPQSMRAAYGLTPLIQKGYTGQGQTIVDIVSFGSPTLQQDVDVFDRQFGLPPITIPQLSPLHEPIYDPRHDRPGWGDETTLDVDIMHALAPGAKIIVLTSPVAETEGTIGLPEFRQLLQYTIDHKLGNIVSQSFGASEATLKDAKGQAEIQKWDTLLKQATTQDDITLLASSGDNGATDYINLEGTKLAPVRTTSFPTDEPWVTSVGGTTLQRTGDAFHETAWNSSGGGFSAFYSQPSYQQSLPGSVQSLMQKRRGVPDVAGNADPNTGLAMYEHGSWSTAGGTSASSPLWAALVAIANQMAGHPLGFINPALYKIGTGERYHQDFNDITVGNNSVNTLSVKVPGYDAVPGWDPITGLGSPNAANLLPDLIKNSGEVGLA